MEEAILREKQLKKWERKWKIRLIEKTNPYWRDLYPEIVDGAMKVTGFPPEAPGMTLERRFAMTVGRLRNERQT
ncbi:MAG TPA: hypothetical protein VGH81_15375 [Rudaea sp.]